MNKRIRAERYEGIREWLREIVERKRAKSFLATKERENKSKILSKDNKRDSRE